MNYVVHYSAELTVWDLVLAPIYLYILVFIAKRYRDKHYKVGDPLRRLYLQGLYVKIFGAIFIGLIYSFYYHEGDTFNYFGHAKIINSADSISTWFKLMTGSTADSDPKLYTYIQGMEFYNSLSAMTVCRITAILGLINGTTYMPIALLFAYISYTGIWAMYTTFVKLYPQLTKQLAWAFLFVPSTFVWGSSIFKDTVCMFGLGWLTYCVFRIFVNGDLSWKNLIYTALSLILVSLIKVYILLAFLPALTFWLLMTYVTRIKSTMTRWLVSVLAISTLVGGIFLGLQLFSSKLDEYSLDNLVEKSSTTREWILYQSERMDGAAYDLGTFEPTVLGLMGMFPAAVNVTLYRPYIWETKKPIQLLSALEGLTFMIATIMLLYRRGLKGFTKPIGKDPNLMFFLVFVLVFAFSVGISTGNFGTLSRYKIPCMPFFAALLVIIFYGYKKGKFIGPTTLPLEEHTETTVPQLV